MSYRERSAWISLVTTLGVWGWYFVVLARSFARGEADGARFVGLFIGCVVAIVALSIVLAIADAVRAPKESEAPADERERLIALRATGMAFPVLSVLVLTVAAASPILAGLGPSIFADDPLGEVTLLTANGVLLAVVVAEVVRSGGQILLYRRPL